MEGRRLSRLECSIVVKRLKDGRATVGMLDPVSGRYEPLGTHGPDRSVIDKVIMDLRRSIESAGHTATVRESSE